MKNKEISQIQITYIYYIIFPLIKFIVENSMNHHHKNNMVDSIIYNLIII